MRTNHSNAEIAQSWTLWTEYIDPDGIGTREEWEAMPLNERVRFIASCFGPEEAEEKEGGA